MSWFLRPAVRLGIRTASRVWTAGVVGLTLAVKESLMIPLTSRLVKPPTTAVIAAAREGRRILRQPKLGFRSRPSNTSMHHPRRRTRLTDWRSFDPDGDHSEGGRLTTSTNVAPANVHRSAALSGLALPKPPWFGGKHDPNGGARIAESYRWRRRDPARARSSQVRQEQVSPASRLGMSALCVN